MASDPGDISDLSESLKLLLDHSNHSDHCMGLLVCPSSDHGRSLIDSVYLRFLMPVLRISCY